MVTVTLDEITLNAIKAALDERIARLEAQTLASSQQIVGWEDGRSWPQDYSEDFQRAYVWAVDALFQSRNAREYLSDPEVLIDHPADATYATYHDWQAAGPR